MRELFRKKHELWLRFLFGSFSLPRGEMADILMDFAGIEFRHLKWLAQKMVDEGLDFDWDRESFSIVHISSKGLCESLLEELRKVQRGYGVGELFERIQSDEKYMSFMLEKMQNENIAIKAFDKELFYEGLDESSKNALIQFLFEELYKEYELIVTYFYSAMHTDSVHLYKVFEDLIYESIYHLKSFALIMAKLGILSLPRVVMREVYKFEDLKEFLQKGIEEEIAAKEQCLALSQAVKDEELSRFFDFINNQEDYHIVLMQKAIKML